MRRVRAYRTGRREYEAEQAAHNFVPAAPRRVDLPTHTSQQWALDVTPSSQQVVHVQTSAVDRATGYTIALVPLAGVLGLLAVLVTLLFDNEFFSFTSLLVFWLVFALCWLVGWIATLLMSAEGVAFFEAKRKWQIVQREQDERWAHWRWQQGREEDV